jgi:tRNA-dihydrouridine synthase
VLGNGDVWEPWDALRMLRATGCSAVIVGRGCLGRPWLFAELAAVLDGREPEPPPRLGRIAQIMVDHAERLCRFFGDEQGMRQMRKWCTWYTVGFRGSARVRGDLVRVRTLAEMTAILARLDPDEEFPLAALRAHRAKGGRTQKVSLPEGYLEARDDDTPPAGPRDAAEARAWERALSGG